MTNYLKKYLVNLNNLKTIERISSGAFGTVYLVQDKKTKQKYAAKMIHSEAEQSKTLINREIGIMIRMQHPTIIKFYGYSLTDFEGKDHVTLLLQFAKNGSLANFLKNVRSGLADHMYDNTTRQKILVGIARGMMYLHKNHAIHRDLKPGNILLDNNFEPPDFIHQVNQIIIRNLLEHRFIWPQKSSKAINTMAKQMFIHLESSCMK